jgi:hypothetical protein
MPKQIAITLLLAGSLLTQTNRPERKVERNAIISAHDPAVRIQLPPSASYVGADRWILYGMADCELHAFVQADSQKRVQHLYWVQFEGYIPTRPELHHTYDSPRHTQIDGLDFYVDTWVQSTSAPMKSGSDIEHIHNLLATNGYTLPQEMMSVRLVHLLDEQKRKELMIIYSENVAPTGLTASDLSDNGRAHEQWPEIERGLIERAKKAIVIDQTARR